jgi:hypothetical protein
MGVLLMSCDYPASFEIRISYFYFGKKLDDTDECLYCFRIEIKFR